MTRPDDAARSRVPDLFLERYVLGELPDGEFVYTMDNGKHIAVAIQIDRDGRTACIDFTGTSMQSDDNFNAPAAICKAAVLYVFRCLVRKSIPLNDGWSRSRSWRI